MKKLALLCLVCVISACSSNEKKDDGYTEPVPTAPVKDVPTPAENKGSDDQTAMTGQASRSACTLDKDTRVIEVKKTEGGGCELFYTKFGEAKSVASSGYGTQYCEEVKDRIQSNLNKAGFSCQ